MSKHKQHKPAPKHSIVSPISTKNKNQASYIYWILLSLVIIFSIFIRIHFLNIPFERDEGSYTYCGKIILDGAIPFKDIGSQRLPGVFYAYSLIVLIFGYTIKSMHVGFLVIHILTVVVVFLIGKNIYSKLTGLVAAMGFVLLSMAPAASGFTIQSEHLVALTGFAGILLLLLFLNSRKIFLLISSGILLSLAFQIKQTSMFYCVFAGTILFFDHFSNKPINWKQLILNSAVYAASFLIPVLFSLVVIYHQGAYADFKLWMFDIASQYSSIISFSDGLEYLQYSVNSIMKDYFFLWMLSFAGPVFILFTKTSLLQKIFIWLLYILCFLTVVPGNHYYGHYFLQFIPAVALSIGVCVYSLKEVFEKRMNMKSFATILPVGIFALGFLGNVSAMKEYYFNPNLTKVLRNVYGLNPFPESWAVAKYLNEKMKTDDRIAVLGTEIQMYVYTNKISPSRFAGSGVLVEFPVIQQKQWQQEFISDVEKVSPKYVVLYAHPISWMTNPKSDMTIFGWIDKYTRENYDIIAYADIYSDQTLYVWDRENVMKNPPNPKSQYKILVYEKKNKINT
jgi:hypothetical protein